MTAEEYVKKRDNLLIDFENMSDNELLMAMIELDIGYFPASPEIARIALHKSRIYSKGVPIELRVKSMDWLAEHNYSENIF